MKAAERDALWQRLVAVKLVSGDTAAQSGDASAWYIRAMLGAAAWIGAIFLLSFVGMALHDLVRTNAAKIVTGLAICAGAAVLLRAPAGIFVAQLGLALSLAGQALFAYGIVDIFDRGTPAHAVPMFVIALLETVLVVVVSGVVHRVICTIGAALALAYGLWAAGLGALGLPLIAAAFVLVELDETRLGAAPRLFPVVGVGLALAVVTIATAEIAGDELFFGRSRERDLLFGPRFADAVMGVVFFGASLWLAARAGLACGTPAHVAVLAGALAVAFVSVGVAGLSAALVILLVGFATSQRLLTGLGTIALLAALARYYYTLSATLLVKSALLLAAAAVLLALWALLRHAAKELDRA
jgi:hypothetical protein